MGFGHNGRHSVPKLRSGLVMYPRQMADLGFVQV